jgi:hypothetical protein
VAAIHVIGKDSGLLAYMVGVEHGVKDSAQTSLHSRFVVLFGFKTSLEWMKDIKTI